MKAVAPSPEPKSGHSPPPRQRKTRSSGSSNSTATAFSSSSSSIQSSPSPSHYTCNQTPLHSSASSIPFSWEQTPGIPKPLPKPLKSSPNPHLLPLPPPLRSDSFCKLAAGAFDPFAVALAECAKDPPAENPDLWIRGRLSEAKGRRRSGIGVGYGSGLWLFGLYGSCKASCSVADSAIVIPRDGQRVAAYRVLNRRVG